MSDPLTGAVVLQVLPALETGGVERGTVEMTAAIVGAGGVALVASQGGRMVAEIERAGGRHIALKLRSRDPLVVWRNAGRLAALIRAEGVGLLHARSRAPAWSARWAARRVGVPFVTTYHAVYGEGVPGKRGYNAVMASGARVIAISHYVAGEVLARHGVTARVIPRGVDPSVFDPGAVSAERRAAAAQAWTLPPGAPVLLLPGRLTRWKGQAVAIEALARMTQPAVLVLAGADQGRHRYVAELRALAASRGVAERVRLPGDCRDMPAALALADIVLSASIEPEGFGRVVIEAQSMARPVVVTDHGGAAETVEHGATGWRVPPGDPAALAAALDHVLALSPADRDARGARARASVQARYTTAAMQAATLDVYRELLR